MGQDRAWLLPSSAAWQPDPHGPCFLCLWSPAPQRDGTPLLEVWGGGVWRIPASHLSSSLPESGPWFPAQGSFGETWCPSQAQDGSWGYGMSGLRDGSGEQGGCVVWDSRRSLQLCRCHRNGAARGLAARQCPGLSAARRSPLPPLRGAALQSAKPGSLLLLTVDIVAESVLLRSHPVLGKVFSNSLGPPSMGPGAEPLL